MAAHPRGGEPTPRLPHRPPRIGELVQVRQRTWLVERITEAPEPGHSPRVALAGADDDAQGEELEVFWDCEPDRRILEAENWSDLGERGFDSPRRFAAYVNTLRWNSVTATDPKLLQAPSAPESAWTPTRWNPFAWRWRCPASGSSSPTTPGWARPSRRA